MAKLVCAARNDPTVRISSGPFMKLHLNVFQGFVIPAFSSAEVPGIVEQLKQHPRLRQSTHLMYAYRVVDGTQQNGEPSDDTAEGYQDGGVLGAGDKLLQVLRRWEVCNAIVLVNRADRSLTGRLIVAQMYKLVVESAKLALEQFAIDSLHPVEAAKLAMHEIAGKNNIGSEQQHLAVQEMRYDGEPTNMVNGVIQGAKQGRINYFQASEEDGGLQNNNKENLRIKSLECIGISKEDLTTLRSVRMPPKELHMVLVCVALLVRSKDISWLGCRDMIHQPTFCSRILSVEPTKLSKKQVAQVRTILQEPNFIPEIVRRVSVVGAAFLTWVVQMMDAYDASRLGFDLEGPMLPESLRDDIDAADDARDEYRMMQFDDLTEWQIERPQPHPPPEHDTHSLLPTDVFSPKLAPAIQDRGRML